jgi:flagellar biosynthesis protein FlhA
MKTEIPENDMKNVGRTTFISAGIAALVFAGITLVSPVILDILIVVNLLLALLAFLIVLLTGKQTRMKIVPKALLICTLFGVMVYIDAALLILIRGTEFDSLTIGFIAGRVKVGGSIEIIVSSFIFFIGALFFFIIVITKSLGRLVEVAGRFVMDAELGENMLIEAEYNSGAISEVDCNIRKIKLQEEYCFWSYMEGTVKFIFGAVKLVLYLIGAVVLGGIITGVTLRGQTLLEAIETYIPFVIGKGCCLLLPLMILQSIVVLVSANDFARRDISSR